VTADGVLEPARVETPQERLERLDLELDDDPVGARRGLRELASSAPRSVRIEAYLLLGDSYRDSHENDEALSAYASAARIGRGTTSGAQALYERATLYERMAHLDDARTAWEQALELDPRDARALGYVEYVRQHYDLVAAGAVGGYGSEEDLGVPFGIGPDDGVPDAPDGIGPDAGVAVGLDGIAPAAARDVGAGGCGRDGVGARGAPTPAGGT
jgi:tetratricopeptide (TPR) repeat protein